MAATEIFKVGVLSFSICQLWYQHPSWLLTLWTKQDSGFLLEGFIIVVGSRIRGGRWCLAIWFDCSALNWDRGLVNCGTNILCGCWHFGRNEIQVFCFRAFIIIAKNRISGERWCLAIWFYGLVLNWGRGLVNCGTNILCGCWLFGQTEIQVFCLRAS